MQSREVICIDSGTSDDEELEQKVEHTVVPETLHAYLCPIGRDRMRDPVTASDGHSYERKNIENWLSMSDKSPLTLLPLIDKTITPNHTLKKAIEEWDAKVKAERMERERAEAKEAEAEVARRVEAQKIEAQILVAEEKAAKAEAAAEAYKAELDAARVELQRIERERLASVEGAEEKAAKAESAAEADKAELDAARVELQRIEMERLASVEDTARVKAVQAVVGKIAAEFAPQVKCHGKRIRKQCSYQDCNSIAQGGGLCVSHGFKIRRRPHSYSPTSST